MSEIMVTQKFTDAKVINEEFMEGTFSKDGLLQELAHGVAKPDFKAPPAQVLFRSEKAFYRHYNAIVRDDYGMVLWAEIKDRETDAEEQPSASEGEKEGS